MLGAERIILSEFLHAMVIKLSPDILVFTPMTSNTDFKILPGEAKLRNQNTDAE